MPLLLLLFLDFSPTVSLTTTIPPWLAIKIYCRAVQFFTKKKQNITTTAVTAVSSLTLPNSAASLDVDASPRRSRSMDTALG